MFRPLVAPLLALVLPPILVGFAYFQFLGHRSDYLGHFLAGFGGTLGAIVLALALSMLLMDDRAEDPLTRPSATLSPQSGARGTALALSRAAGWITLVVVLACIGLGAIFEETLYHIAKWDEVDFCNQSLGAVLAGLAALAALPRSPPHPQLLSRAGRGEDLRSRAIGAVVAGAWGAIVLAGGYYFAFR